MPVTCIKCRGTIDEAGHQPTCPILQEELAVYQLLAGQKAKWLTNE
jgi:hypothetical protein